MRTNWKMAAATAILGLGVAACVAAHNAPTQGSLATPPSGAAISRSSLGPGVSAASPDTSLSPDVNLSKEVTVPAGGYIDVPFVFEGSPTASVTVVGAPAGITASFAGTPLTEQDTALGKILGVSLSSPSDGLLRLTNSGSSDSTVSVVGYIETTRHLTVTASATIVNLGSPIDLSVALSQPVAGDVVQAELIDPAGTHRPIAMTDAGGGTWIGQVTPSVGGTNQIRAWTSGNGVRYGASTVEVESGTVTIGASFSASINDFNGNGLADTLVLTPTVTIGRAGTYEIDADLIDASGAFVAKAQMSPDTSTGWYDLTTGTQQLALTFDGATIYKSGKSGPYHLANLSISRLVDGKLHPEASVADMGATQAYDYRIFEHLVTPKPPVSCSACRD
jgi:hypothetical protein